MVKRNLQDVEWQGRFAHQKALLFTEDELHSKGAKFQVIKISPGGRIEPHYHKVRTEVFYVLQGEGTITLGADHMPCQVHDFMICEAPTVHAFKNDSDKDFIVAVFRTNDPGDSDMLWVTEPA